MNCPKPEWSVGRLEAESLPQPPIEATTTRTALSFGSSREVNSSIGPGLVGGAAEYSRKLSALANTSVNAQDMRNQSTAEASELALRAELLVSVKGMPLHPGIDHPPDGLLHLLILQSSALRRRRSSYGCPPAAWGAPPIATKLIHRVHRTELLTRAISYALVP
ncbi:hypothetical protein HPB47_012405 [Ixodes persulcatus]|uniref:Uncharacterized protein n=1 Tax=Ixodes persulcatus TaxID=34615 RepID=A0AC60NTM9_IXOPE|nr:hypothetical protein HPB47_012405 [Ixodes persulcatus]